MYFTSCSEAFRKMSASLTGPSPLFSPAKQGGDASKSRDHWCGRWQKLPPPLHPSAYALALPSDSVSPSIERWSLVSSLPWILGWLLDFLDQDKAVGVIFVLVLRRWGPQKPALVLVTLLRPWPLPREQVQSQLWQNKRQPRSKRNQSSFPNWGSMDVKEPGQDRQDHSCLEEFR